RTLHICHCVVSTLRNRYDMIETGAHRIWASQLRGDIAPTNPAHPSIALEYTDCTKALNFTAANCNPPTMLLRFLPLIARGVYPSGAGTCARAKPLPMPTSKLAPVQSILNKFSATPITHSHASA